MRNLGSIFISMVLSFGLAYAASVEATVNTKEVVKGNSVQLRIKAIGRAAAFPTIRDMDGVMVTNSGTSRQSSMQITVNGMQKETSTVRKYIFTPEHDMVIPSYTVRIGGDNYKTKPISIKVVTSQAPKVKSEDIFSFVLKADRESVFLGESFVATIYMSISGKLQGIQISDYAAPSSSDFFIKEIEGQKEYQHNGYTVIEKQYIITTKKEGNVTIAPATAKLGQPDWSRQDIFGRPSISWTAIRSNQLNVEVKALQTEADLVGDFQLKVKLDAQSVKPNKPVNLTVTIKGKGSLEDFEFPKYEMDGVTVYGDEAKVESHIEKGELLSTYSKSFAFISEDDFSIPARNISMYNPQTKETKTLEVPSYEVSIKGKKVPTMNVQGIEKTKVQSTEETSESQNVKKVLVEKSIAWWMLVLAFILGALFMYLWQFVPKLLAKKQKSFKASEALQVLYAHISEDKKVEEMVRKLYAKKNGDKSIHIDKKELREMLERFR